MKKYKVNVNGTAYEITLEVIDAPANAPAAPRQSSYSAASRISSPSNPIAVQGLDQAWDNQYWSLWITDGGGGTFKDIWTANTYAGSGLYVSNTDTPTRMYAVSLEHHVRTESRFSNVKNWKLYAMQYEEESREGKDCVSLVMDNCENLRFANTWFYRVIRVNTPRDYGMLVSNSRNIDFRNMRCWTQVLYLTAATAYDANKQTGSQECANHRKSFSASRYSDKCIIFGNLCICK